MFWCRYVTPIVMVKMNHFLPKNVGNEMNWLKSFTNDGHVVKPNNTGRCFIIEWNRL